MAQLDPAKWVTVDKVYQGYLRTHPDLSNYWLLAQTFFTGAERRAFLAMLRLQEGWKVLDFGTGFGPVAMEIAGLCALEVHGVDTDAATLGAAEEMRDTLDRQQWFQPGSSVTFRQADLYALPYEADSFDLVIGRLVYQHLDDPETATAGLLRVVRPGGMACIVDVDDQLSFTYPEPTDAFSRLHDAYTNLQYLSGGDRYVGRKLSTYLESAGFDIAMCLVLPQAQHAPAAHLDHAARQITLNRLREARGAIIGAGLLTAAEFDECIVLYELEHSVAQFTVNGQVAVIARKPA